MDKASQITLGLSKAGLMNNPKFCIKGMGATITCVCEPCMKESSNRVGYFFECMEKYEGGEIMDKYYERYPEGKPAPTLLEKIVNYLSS